MFSPAFITKDITLPPWGIYPHLIDESIEVDIFIKS